MRGAPSPHGRRGFSLVELMISIGLFSLVSVAVLSAGLHFSKTFARLSSEADLARRSRTFQSHFSNDVRGATTIAQLNSSTLRLVLPDATTIDYSLQATADQQYQVLRTTAGESLIVLPEVSAWSVQLPTASTPLEASITLLHRDPTRGTVSHPITVRVSPRAHAT